MISKLRNYLKGKKSYLLMVTGVIGVVISWSTGDIESMEMVKLIFACLSVGTIRAGVEKNKGDGDE